MCVVHKTADVILNPFSLTYCFSFGFLFVFCSPLIIEQTFHVVSGKLTVIALYWYVHACNLLENRYFLICNEICIQWIAITSSTANKESKLLLLVNNLKERKHLIIFDHHKCDTFTKDFIPIQQTLFRSIDSFMLNHKMIIINTSYPDTKWKPIYFYFL